MWLIQMVCSDDDCAQEIEALVAEIEDVDRIVCECGCSLVTLAVAEAIEVRLPGASTSGRARSRRMRSARSGR